MSSETGSKSVGATPNLPVVYVPEFATRNADRFALPSSFASQLLASRDRMAVRSAQHMSPANLASDAYTKGGKIAVKRMPNGYVRTLVV